MYFKMYFEQKVKTPEEMSVDLFLTDKDKGKTFSVNIYREPYMPEFDESVFQFSLPELVDEELSAYASSATQIKSGLYAYYISTERELKIIKNMRKQLKEALKLVDATIKESGG